MARKYTALTFTDSVKAAQEHYGTRSNAARVEAWDIDDQNLTEREMAHIAQRDSFYMSTVGEDGWPYVQFRGGPKGFLKVLGPRKLGYADFRGNLQYISMGNVRKNDRVALILMDYPNRQRLKIMARATVIDIDQDPELVEKLQVPAYKARVERAVILDVEAFDWNCPQHITPRFTAEET
jgi:hypothetical protein